MAHFIILNSFNCLIFTVNKISCQTICSNWCTVQVINFIQLKINTHLRRGTKRKGEGQIGREVEGGGDR